MSSAHDLTPNGLNVKDLKAHLKVAHLLRRLMFMAARILYQYAIYLLTPLSGHSLLSF